MDDPQPVWSVIAWERRCAYVAEVADEIGRRVQRDAEEGYADVHNLACDVAWLARQLAVVVRYMSREGKGPDGADSTGETRPDGGSLRTPWRGQSIGDTPR